MAVSTERRWAHVVLPTHLVRQIAERVGQRQRSEFIQEAIEEKLNRLRRVEAFKRVVGSIADGEIPEWETRESTSAWLHDLCEEVNNREPTEESRPMSRLSRVEAFERVVGSPKEIDAPGWESPEAVAKQVHDLRYTSERLAAGREDLER
jgi:Arc/MetJ-type ribon-helix-helix transcriptional regulator